MAALAALGDTSGRKIVVLGVPWEVDSDGLRSYFSTHAAVEDAVVIKDRNTGRSRGFGYVTFINQGDAEVVLSKVHVLSGRTLEVKIATPKSDMKPTAQRVTRIFVARVPQSVTDEDFKNYFEQFGMVLDSYMPKDSSKTAHKNIGFITFKDPESVDAVMGKAHELGGSPVAIAHATPKEEMPKGGANQWGYGPMAGGFSYQGAGMGGFGDVDPMTGQRTFGYDQGMGLGGGMGQGGSGLGTRIFVGRLPADLSLDELRGYFSAFGRVTDVYLPKDAKSGGYRGFGFITFSDEAAAERVASRPHEIRGKQIAVDRAAPKDGDGGMGGGGGSGFGAMGGAGPIRGPGARAVAPGAASMQYYSQPAPPPPMPPAPYGIPSYTAAPLGAPSPWSSTLDVGAGLGLGMNAGIGGGPQRFVGAPRADTRYKPY